MEIVRLIDINEFLNKKKKISSSRITKWEEENIVKCLEKSTSLCGRDLIASAKLVNVTPKQLTHRYKSEERREIEIDGNIEVIELINRLPIHFALKRRVCERNCGVCEVRERCVESEWDE